MVRRGQRHYRREARGPDLRARRALLSRFWTMLPGESQADLATRVARVGGGSTGKGGKGEAALEESRQRGETPEKGGRQFLERR